MSRIETTEEWILEDLAAITGKDIKELRKSKVRTKSTPVNRHKYFRRPGKRHNNDFCFSCREGGTLICCDGCTKSFHLLCLDPPMEDEDIPEGEWLCKTCKLGKKPTSDGVISLHFLSKKRKRSIEDDNSEESKEAKLIRSIWSQLIRKALESDPKEYENPLDCRTIPYIFPGDSKSAKKNQIKLKHPHSTQCYICGKGLSKQSMINCDYCERSFHLDCTDPPLTVPPKYFWMCQFHIEPCLEQIFYQEEMPSLSQRIALWDMCRKPIDHEAVKLEFLRNTVTDPNKIVQLPTVPIEIPDAVYNHYNNRPDMIPSLKEALRLVGYDQSMEFLQKVPFLKKDDIVNISSDNEKTSKEEQELWLATILGFQKDLISRLNNETVKEFVENKKGSDIAKIEEDKVELVEKEVVDREENSNASDTLSNRSKNSTISANIKVKKPHDAITKVLEAAVAELPEADECLNIMNYLDEEFINVLAFQRLCQLLNYNKLHSKLLEDRTFHQKQSLNSTVEGTKSLTNPQLEQFVGLELKNTLDHGESDKYNKVTEEIETIIISDGENYRRIDKEDLKLIIEEGVDHDSSNDKTDELIEVDIKLEESKESEFEQNVSLNEVFDAAGKKNNIGLQVKTVKDESEKNSCTEQKGIIKTEEQESEIKKTNYMENEKVGSKEVSVANCDSVKEEKGIAKVSMVSFHDNICGDGKILGVLTSVDKQSELFPIYKSGFIIGKGSSVNLDLNKCGHCNFISNHHAVIYVDERTHLWEIINYSRFGCHVNNVLLSFDVPKKALQNILDEDSEEEFCSFHESVKNISKQQFALLDTKVIKSERDEVIKQFYKNPCNCDPKEMHSNMSLNGWNNSTPFGHGSLLRFGCLGLVFGDTSYVIS